MDDTSKTGISVEQPSSPRRTATIGWAILAIAAQVALADAAIETFRGGSAIRWWVAPPVLVFVALGVWLWRPGGWAAKRWGWEGAAPWSIGGLLVLFTVTAWLPEGQVNGVRMALQPTSTVLTAATIWGVLLAGWSLARLKALPWPARVAFGVLAAYGVAAFAIGIRTRTPYAALLHGASLWEKAPFWLQGAFLGALVVLPAGLLLQLITGVSQIRAGQLGNWGRRALVLALCAAIAVSGVTSAAGPSVSIAAAHEATPFPQPPPNPFATKAAPMAYEQAADRFHRLEPLTESLTGLVNPAMLDVGARAKQLGPNIDAVFAFVRDAVGFEPYAGVLRGARGALIAQSANALDKSLLLAELLSAQGYKVRIVPGVLSDKDTETLMQLSLRTQPPQASLSAERIEQILSEARETEFLAQAKSAQSYTAAVLNWVSQRSVGDAASIAEATGTPAQWFADTTSKRLREQTASHFWVQVEQSSIWVDLDPSFSEARIGQRFAVPGEAFEPSAPPRDLLQTVAIKLTAEYAAEGDRSQQVVLDAVLPTQDLVAQQMHFVNEPVGACCQDDLSHASKFQAVLQVGKRQFKGTQYTLSGSAAAGALGGPQGLFGALGGGESAARVLTGLWMDVSLSGPGLKPRTERRYLLDRIGFSARAQRKEAPIVAIPAEQLPYLLSRSYDILVMPAPYSDSLSGWVVSQFLLENRNIFRLAIDVRYGKAAPAKLMSALATGSRLSFPLLSFAAIASERLRAIEGGTRLILERPLVAMHKEGFGAPSGPMGAPGAATTIEEGFDIVFPGAVPAGGDAKHRAAAGIGYGTFLTNLELAAVSQMAGPLTPRILNASANLEAARKQGPGLVALRKAGEHTAAGASEDVAARFKADLEAGYMVVTVPANSRQSPGQGSWWRLDPGSGVVLGVGMDGEGQAMTEYQKGVMLVAGMVFCQVKAGYKGEKGQTFGMVLCMLMGWMGTWTVFAADFFTAIMIFLVAVWGWGSGVL